MKIIKIIFGVVSIMMMFIIAGCDLPTTNDGDETPITQEDFKKGKNGIEIDFMEGAPPKEIYEGNNFKVIGSLRNKGARIAEGYLTIGVERDYVTVLDESGGKVEYKTTTQTEARRAQGASEDDDQDSEDGQEEAVLENKYFTKTFTIKPRSVGIPNGEMVTSEFLLQAIKAGTQTSKHTSTILLTSCYDYSTSLEDDICIDPDVYSTSTLGKVCDLKTTTYSSQGAPVAITKIEPTITEKTDKDTVTLILNIYVKNVGNGMVINNDKTRDACNAKSIDRNDWNVVKIKNIKIGNEEYIYDPEQEDPGNDKRTIYCNKPEERIMLDQAILRCEYRNVAKTSSPAYNSPMQVQIEYGYMESVSQNIDILRRK